MDNQFGTLLPESSTSPNDFQSLIPPGVEIPVFPEYGVTFTAEPNTHFFTPSPFEFAGSSSLPRHASLDNPRLAEDLYIPVTRRHSLTDDDKEGAKERRRTQNRFAQRAYRQRKEQAIKDQEKEIESLKMQLAKEKKLNQALAKVVEFLKERLNSKQSK